MASTPHATATLAGVTRISLSDEGRARLHERLAAHVEAGVVPGLAALVAAVHAGVIEACLISFLGVPADVYRRGWVHIVHASMTEIAWVPDGDRFILLRFNDACGIPSR